MRSGALELAGAKRSIRGSLLRSTVQWTRAWPSLLLAGGKRAPFSRRPSLTPESTTPMGMWVLCFVAWLLKRACEALSGESMVMCWGGAQLGTTAACFSYCYSHVLSNPYIETAIYTFLRLYAHLHGI